MTCRSCGASIAEKAIVCYRCGAPTATPVVSARAPGARGRRVWPIVVVLVAVVAAAVAWWILQCCGQA